MKLTYYGTAAAEGVPGLYCECETCEKARKKGGRNIRTRSQAMVDDKILIDFPADTYLHVLMYGLPLHKIKTYIITHSHGDHLYPGEFTNRRKGFSHLKDATPLQIYGSQAVMNNIMSTQIMKDYMELMTRENDIMLHTIEPFVPFNAEGYKITALNADHGAPGAMFYMLEKDGKAMLYAHDTGLFPNETMEYLKNSEVYFDLISLDCTNGLIETANRNHMGLDGDTIMRERLTDIGCIDERTKCIVNHFSHNCLAGYDEIVPIAAEKGFEVSYDSMTVEF